MKHLPGFRPMNPYAWAYFGFRGRLVMLVLHARFIPRPVQATYATWRLNRTPGPRHPYPWECS